jgi:hypothetical protein
MKNTRIKKNIPGIGADGIRVGAVDGTTGGRIRLSKDDSDAGPHEGHHHFV